MLPNMTWVVPFWNPFLLSFGTVNSLLIEPWIHSDTSLDKPWRNIIYDSHTTNLVTNSHVTLFFQPMCTKRSFRTPISHYTSWISVHWTSCSRRRAPDVAYRKPRDIATRTLMIFVVFLSTARSAIVLWHRKPWGKLQVQRFSAPRSLHTTNRTKLPRPSCPANGGQDPAAQSLASFAHFLTCPAFLLRRWSNGIPEPSFYTTSRDAWMPQPFRSSSGMTMSPYPPVVSGKLFPKLPRSWNGTSSFAYTT